MSLLMSGLGVVNNLSPAKMEEAPAIKQRACPSSDISVRPADNRTTALGITIRAVATMRNMSQMGTIS